MVAYFRLKVSDNTSADPVARISVKGGGTEYGPLSLKGTDFDAVNTYQEFAIPFTFHTNPDDAFLFFNFWRSGEADLTVDGVTIFTEPQPVTSPFVWDVPGGNYRGGGIWVRYSEDAGTFSAIKEANLYPSRMGVSPDSLFFLTEEGGVAPKPRTLTVQQGCASFTWDATENASWLEVQPVEDAIEVSVDATGLPTGTYQATVTVTADGDVLGNPAQVPVTLKVVDTIHPTFLPMVLQNG
jgi:hypothetical protein